MSGHHQGAPPAGFGFSGMGGGVQTQAPGGMGLGSGFVPSGKMVSGGMMTMSEPGGFNAGSSYSFDDEPPLLEELGIDVGSILRKSTAMLRPHGLRAETLVDGDLIGPVLFCLLLATAHLLAGKVLFGYVLGWSLISSFVTSTVIGMLVPATEAGASGAGGGGTAVASGAYGDMAMHDGGGRINGGGGSAGAAKLSSKVEFGMTASLLGYSMLPMVGGTVFASVMPRGIISTTVTFLCVIWSSTTSSSLITIVTPALKSVYYLVLYPCVLFYSVYALLALY